MVARILRLDELPQPADAADALALALCHAWRGGPARRGIRTLPHAGAAGVGGRRATRPAMSVSLEQNCEPRLRLAA